MKSIEVSDDVLAGFEDLRKKLTDKLGFELTTQQAMLYCIKHVKLSPAGVVGASRHKDTEPG